jgi:antitoxin ParD1/3/4
VGMVKKSITITDKQDAWIKAQIDSGNYGNDSEVLRDLIRQKQDRDAEIESIRAAIIEGEQSGMSSRTPRQIVREAKKRLRADGKI